MNIARMNVGRRQYPWLIYLTAYKNHSCLKHVETRPESLGAVLFQFVRSVPGILGLACFSLRVDLGRPPTIFGRILEQAPDF